MWRQVKRTREHGGHQNERSVGHRTGSVDGANGFVKRAPADGHDDNAAYGVCGKRDDLFISDTCSTRHQLYHGWTRYRHHPRHLFYAPPTVPRATWYAAASIFFITLNMLSHDRPTDRRRRHWRPRRKSYVNAQRSANKRPLYSGENRYPAWLDARARTHTTSQTVLRDN